MAVYIYIYIYATLLYAILSAPHGEHQAGASDIAGHLKGNHGANLAHGPEFATYDLIESF